MSISASSLYVYVDLRELMQVFRSSLPVCPAWCLDIEHSSATHTQPHTSKHTQTYTSFPTGALCLCCVINQSCQTDFSASSEKKERQPPNNLEKMEES